MSPSMFSAGVASMVTIASPKAAATAPPNVGLVPSTVSIAIAMISALPTSAARPNVRTASGTNRRVSSGQSTALRTAIRPVVTSAPSNEGTASPGSTAVRPQNANADTSQRARRRTRIPSGRRGAVTVREDALMQAEPAGEGRTPDHLTWVGHSTVLLELDGRRLLTDPILHARIGPLLRAGPRPPEAIARDLSAVLISHIHLDHLHTRSLGGIDRATPVIVPRGAGSLLHRRGFADVIELGAGEQIEVDGVAVAAVPAHHDGQRHPLGGTRAETIGFVIGTTRRVYFAGDTELFDEMAELGGELDVALIPIAGWGPTLGPGHMGPRDAATALTLLRPRLAVPIHWGTLYPLGLGLGRREKLAAPSRDFARQAAELAPAVQVRVLGPGEALSLDS